MTAISFPSEQYKIFIKESIGVLRNKTQENPKLFCSLYHFFSDVLSFGAEVTLDWTAKAIDILTPQVLNHSEVQNFLETVKKTAYFAKQKPDNLINLFSTLCKFQSPNVNLFLESGLDSNTYGKGMHLLHIACFYNHVNAVRSLINNFANINAVNYNKSTPLHIACQMGHGLIVEELLSHNANLDAIDLYGNSPLILACFSQNTPISLALIDKGACVNIKNDKNCTALHKASFCGLTEVIKKLLENNAEISVTNKHGYTAKAMAIFNNQIDCLEYFPGKGLYTQEFVFRKFLGQMNGLDSSSKLATKVFTITGGYVPLFIHKYNDYYSKFTKDYPPFLSPEYEKRFLKIFDFEKTEIFGCDIIGALQKEKSIALSTGWHKHSIILLFFQEKYLLILNGGEGIPNNRQTISIFPYDPSKISENLFVKIRNHQSDKCEVAREFFYHTLPEELKAETYDQTEYSKFKMVLNSYANKPAKIGICCLKSVKILFRTLHLLFTPDKVNPEYTKQFCKRFSLFCRLQAQEEYLDHSFQTNFAYFDYNLLLHVHNKIFSNLQKIDLQGLEQKYSQLKARILKIKHPMRRKRRLDDR